MVNKAFCSEHCFERKISDTIFIEIGIVKNHVHTVLEKLNVHSRQAAAIYLSISEPERESIGV